MTESPWQLIRRCTDAGLSVIWLIGRSVIFDQEDIMNESMHIVCPQCDVINRIPSARLSEAPKCGKCHRPLFDGHSVELTESTFQQHISHNDIPLLVDFWAPWCGPCKMMAPQFAQAAIQLEPKVRLAKSIPRLSRCWAPSSLFAVFRRWCCFSTVVRWHVSRELWEWQIS